MVFLKRMSGLRGRWPYYAPSPLRGGATKGARGGRFGIREGIAHVPHSRDALTRAKDAKPRRRSGRRRGTQRNTRGLRANHFVKSGEEVSAGELFFNDGEIDLLGGELEHARNIAHMLVATAFGVPDDFPNHDVLCWCKENFSLRQCGGPTILPRPLEKRVLGAGIEVCF